MKTTTGWFYEFCSIYEAHAEQIPQLKNLTSQVIKALKVVSPKIQKLPFFLRSNVDFSLYALSDLNGCLVEMLEDNHLCSVEALARTAIEQAVNLIYVIEGESDERAKSFITHYLDKSTKDAERWKNFADVRGLKGSVQSASKKLQHLQYLRGQIDASRKFNDIPDWPRRVSVRFEKVGVEVLYHTIFAAASDSIHGFSEDIFNSTTFHYLPEEVREDAFSGYMIEKKSFAVYLAVYSLGLLIQASYSLACKVEAQDVAEELNGMAEVVNSMIATHENDNNEMGRASRGGSQNSKKGT